VATNVRSTDLQYFTKCRLSVSSQIVAREKRLMENNLEPMRVCLEGGVFCHLQRAAGVREQETTIGSLAHAINSAYATDYNSTLRVKGRMARIRHDGNFSTCAHSLIMCSFFRHRGSLRAERLGLDSRQRPQFLLHSIQTGDHKAF
jgi:hypothetical protein